MTWPDCRSGRRRRGEAAGGGVHHGNVTDPETYRVADGTGAPFADAKRAWTAAARPALDRLAATYGAFTTYKDLAEEVQQATGIRSRMRMRYWIGGVLGAVAHQCRRQGEPLLSALCVDAQGRVGPGYEEAVAEAYSTSPDDPQMHAANERLACYRFFGATIPEGGGRPILTPQVAARRRVAERQRPPKPATCPTCHLALPLTGQCDFCTT